MSSHPFDHPSLNLRVTEEQRDRALDYLQNAYADGRLDEIDFEGRVSAALAASTRRELNKAFAGLAHIPISHAAVQPLASVRPREGATNLVAGLLHWSALFGWIVVPAITYGITERGSELNVQAAKALNFQLLMAIVMVLSILGTIAVGWIGVGIAVASLTWFISTIVMGARALNGSEVRYPLGAIAFVPTKPRPALPRR